MPKPQAAENFFFGVYTSLLFKTLWIRPQPAQLNPAGEAAYYSPSYHKRAAGGGEFKPGSVNGK